MHAFLTESDDAVVGSSAMFECVGAFDANRARQARCAKKNLYGKESKMLYTGFVAADADVEVVSKGTSCCSWRPCKT